jgi:hypothetical protein
LSPPTRESSEEKAAPASPPVESAPVEASSSVAATLPPAPAEQADAGSEAREASSAATEAPAEKAASVAPLPAQESGSSSAHTPAPTTATEAAHQTPLVFAQPEGGAAGAATHEDSSYPPVDLDADFFASSPRSGPPSEHHVDLDERDPHLARKLTPGVAHRRKELAKYVKLAVGLSSALCLAALVKVAVAGRGEGEVPRRHVATSSPAQQAVADPPARGALAEPTAQAATVAPNPAPPSAEAPAAAEQAPVKEGESAAQPGREREEAVAAQEPSAGSAAPAASEAANPAPAETAAGEVDPEQAKKEKTTSRVALERGKLTEAIEAGERSVALDPTDGEAWLILGAAYQTKGNAKEARRCYKACLEQGKRGPRGECSAMLR